MVRISVEDRHQLSRATFVHRSSTPLISSVCENCRGGGESGRKDHNQKTRINSFFQWEKKLSSPICYRVDSDDQQQSIYRPVQKQQKRRKDPPAITNPTPPPSSWINRQRDVPEKSREKLQKKMKNLPHLLLTTDESLFLDPAVMGIKRQGQGQQLQPPPRGAETNNGIEFIREFFLRQRHCSFIEARLRDNAKPRVLV